MRFRHCVFLFILCLTATAAALPPEIALTRVLEPRGELTRVLIDDQRTHSDRITACGTAVIGLQKFYLVNFDSTGAIRWADDWGQNDRCYSMTRDADSNAVMVGRTLDVSETDYRVMHADWDGVLHGNDDYGLNGYSEWAFEVVEWTPDSLVVVGEISASGSAESDLSVLKIDLDGNLHGDWSFALGASGRDLSVVGDSLLWVYGVTDSMENASADFLMLRTRLDTLGNELVSYTFGGPLDEVCRAAVRVDENLTIMVGETYSFSDNPLRSDIWILATNDNGDSLWSRAYGDTLDDRALSVMATADQDSGYLLSGFISRLDIDTTVIDSADTLITVIDTLVHHNALLLKLDSMGDSLWAILLNGEDETEFRDVAVDGGYHYHCVGLSGTTVDHPLYVVTDPDPAAPIQHPPDPFSLLTPAQGDTLYEGAISFTWEASDDPDPDDEVLYALLLDSDTLFEEPIAIGPLMNPSYTWPSDTDDVVIYWRVVAQDNHGNLRICRERHRDFMRVIPDSTAPFSLAYPDSGAILTEPFTELRWERAEDPDLIDEVVYDLVFEVRDTTFSIDDLTDTTISISLVNNPIIAQSDTVYWHVRANSRLPEMTRDSREVWSFINWNEAADPAPGIVQTFALGPVYPNPFNATTTIRYSIDRIGAVRLDVFDLNGRNVETLVDAERWPGSYSTRWDGTSSGRNVASGMYFLRLTAGSQIRTARILLLK